MPINPSSLTNYALFKKFWTTPEGTHDGLAHRGLDEVTPLGAHNLVDFAKKHELDGTPSAPGSQKIDDDEKLVMRAILEHQHYGSFFELDARPLVIDGFGLPKTELKPTPSVHHPVDAGEVKIPAGGSKIPAAKLAMVDAAQLPALMEAEYTERKAHFDGAGKPAEKGLRALALLKSYADALWSRGETDRTEAVGNALLDAFEQMKFAKEANKDYSGIGWSAAQSLVLGHDPNQFKGKFPEAYPTAETTYLAMNDGMAEPMKFVDQFRAKLGKSTGAEKYERASPLGWMLGVEPGHTKRGNLDEKKAFSSSGLNWGLILFPGDAEVKNLEPKKGFDFAIDCIDAWGNTVTASAARGDRLVVVDEAGKPLKAEKVIEKDAQGKAVSWSAVFKNDAGEVVDPSKVLGLIKDKAGKTKGDGKASRSLDMWWWGFCDRNTAQRLYKSTYKMPQLDRDQIKVKVGQETMAIPREAAQKLIDADVPDLVTGETYCGFRFNDEPQIIRLKNGEAFQGRVQGLALEAGPGTTRIQSDVIAVHDAPKRPMLGTLEVKTSSGTETIDVRNLISITREADGSATLKTKDQWSSTVKGELLTEVPWAKAKDVDGKKVLEQGEDMPIRGGFTIALQDGSTRRVTASEVSQIQGETQKDLRLSQFMVWVGQTDGMYATDASTGPVVSNGMRWTNKLDVRDEDGDARPQWAEGKDLVGIEGPLQRQAGDRMLFVQGLYGQNADSDPTSSAFSGWVQVSKSGRILNEGFVSGQPDFGWGAIGKLDWMAKSSFNPFVEPDLRLSLFVNGVKDQAKLEAMATAGNLPSNWKSYLVPQE
jgi:hypothetical protein